MGNNRLKKVNFVLACLVAIASFVVSYQYDVRNSKLAMQNTLAGVKEVEEDIPLMATAEISDEEMVQSQMVNAPMSNRPATSAGTGSAPSNRPSNSDEFLYFQYEGDYVEFSLELTNDMAIIDWGDGSEEDVVGAGEVSHKYSSHGKYTVQIRKHGVKALDLSGETGIYSLSLNDCIELEELRCGNTGISDLDITGCENLIYLDCNNTNIDVLDLTGSPDLEYLYYGEGIQSINLNSECKTRLKLSGSSETIIEYVTEEEELPDFYLNEDDMTIDLGKDYEKYEFAVTSDYEWYNGFNTWYSANTYWYSAANFKAVRDNKLYVADIKESDWNDEKGVTIREKNNEDKGDVKVSVPKYMARVIGPSGTKEMYEFLPLQEVRCFIPVYAAPKESIEVTSSSNIAEGDIVIYKHFYKNDIRYIALEFKMPYSDITIRLNTDIAYEIQTQNQIEVFASNFEHGDRFTVFCPGGTIKGSYWENGSVIDMDYYFEDGKVSNQLSIGEDVDSRVTMYGVRQILDIIGATSDLDLENGRMKLTFVNNGKTSYSIVNADENDVDANTFFDFVCYVLNHSLDIEIEVDEVIPVEKNWVFGIVTGISEEIEDEENDNIIYRNIRVLLSDGTISRDYKFIFNEDKDDYAVFKRIQDVEDMFIGFLANEQGEISLDSYFIVIYNSRFEEAASEYKIQGFVEGTEIDAERKIIGNERFLDGETVIFNMGDDEEGIKPEILTDWDLLVKDGKLNQKIYTVCKKDSSEIMYVYGKINTVETGKYAIVETVDFEEKRGTTVKKYVEFLTSDGVEELEVRNYNKDYVLGKEGHFVEYSLMNSKLENAVSLVDLPNFNKLKPHESITTEVNNGFETKLVVDLVVDTNEPETKGTVKANFKVVDTHNLVVEYEANEEEVGYSFGGITIAEDVVIYDVRSGEIKEITFTELREEVEIEGFVYVAPFANEKALGYGTENVEANILVVMDGTAQSVIEETAQVSWKWEAEKGKNTVKIVSNNNNFVIDWGDGTKEEVIGSEAKHEYANSGEYAVCVYGNITELEFERGNSVRFLDVSDANTLTRLSCEDGKLETIQLNKNIEYLYLDFAEKTTIDVSGNINLKQLRLSNINELNLSANSELTYLYLTNCDLPKLDLRNNTKLKTLYCPNNNIRTINLDNISQITSLNCHGNRIKDLDISNLTMLKSLTCYDNEIISLDISNNYNLTGLCCSQESLEVIYVNEEQKEKMNLIDEEGCAYVYSRNNEIHKHSNTVIEYVKEGNDGESTEEPSEQPVKIREFKDVRVGDWYYDIVTTTDYLEGTTSVTFSPDDPLTREMFIAALYNVAGEPYTNGTNAFPDIPEGSWSEDAIIWACENDLVSGFEDGRFKPSENITRQEAIVVLKKYAEYEGRSTENRADLTSFADYNDIYDWAVESISWAVAEGVISGDNHNELSAREDLTRAETVAIFNNLIKALK